MTARIRLMRAEELPRVHELEREYTESGETLEAIQARYTRHPNLFVVATLGDQIIGEASGYQLTEHTTLKAICVTELYQRRGIGRHLLTAFEQHARQDADIVDVAAGEGGAEAFYLACGYRPKSLLVGVLNGNLPGDYQATEYPITGERIIGERHLFYVDAPTYDPAHKEAVRARFHAAGMNYIFVKRVR